MNQKILSKIVYRPFCLAGWCLQMVLLTIFCCGCSNASGNLTAVSGKTLEKSRELISAAGIANHAAQKHLASAAASITNQADASLITRAAEATDLSGKFIDRSQAQIGMPAQNQQTRVDALLSTNAAVKEAAWEKEFQELRSEQKVLLEQVQLQQKVFTEAQKYEQEQKRNFWAQLRYWLKVVIASVLCAGLIYLLVMTGTWSVALHFFSQVIGWIIGHIPAAVHWLAVTVGHAKERHSRIETSRALAHARK